MRRKVIYDGYPLLRCFLRSVWAITTNFQPVEGIGHLDWRVNHEVVKIAQRPPYLAKIANAIKWEAVLLSCPPQPPYLPPSPTVSKVNNSTACSEVKGKQELCENTRRDGTCVLSQSTPLIELVKTTDL